MKNRIFNQQKFITQNIVERNGRAQYSYEIISGKNIEGTEYSKEPININIKIRNDGLDWPIGSTALINDEKSDIRADNIKLPGLKNGESHTFNIMLKLDEIDEGIKKCIFYLNVENKNYDNPLVINVNVKEDDNVVKFRKEYNLLKEDYNNKGLLTALRKNNFDYPKTFSYLFN